MRSFLAVALMLVSTSVFAQPYPGGAFTVGGLAVPICTIGSAEGKAKQLAGVGTPDGRCGSAVDGFLAAVNDAVSKGDCSMGGGSVVTVCQYDAAQAGDNKWVGTVGAAQGDQVSVNSSATADPTFDDSADIAFVDAANHVTATLLPNSVELGAATTGNYCAAATADGGLTFTGTEGGTLGLKACTANQVLKTNGSVWDCSDQAGGNSFQTMAPTSGTTPVADSATDTLTITAGAGVTITGDATADSLTIASTLGAAIDPAEMEDADFVAFTCWLGACSLNANTVTSSSIYAGVDPAKLGGGLVSAAEFDRLDGLSSPLQTQLNARILKAGDTMTGVLNMDSHKVTNLTAGSDPADAVRFDQVPVPTNLILRAGTQAFTGQQSMGGYKLNSVGEPSSGSTSAARHKDIPFACGTSDAYGQEDVRCKRVDDDNDDGDLSAELQAAINALIWPSGALTAETDVYLAAPQQGGYTLGTRIVICGDTSPPSGATAPDCTGTALIPTIHFIGPWDKAKLYCTMANTTNVVNYLLPCIQIGDAWGDSGDFTKNANLAFDDPLDMTTTVGIDGGTLVSTLLLWCNGCTGDLKLSPHVGAGTASATGPLAVIAGGRLHSEIQADNAAGLLTSIVMDGQQAGSTIQMRASDVSLEIGSSVSAGFGRWGSNDGCGYNGFTSTECDDLQVLPGTSLEGLGSAALALLEIAQSRAVIVDGSFRATGANAKPTIEAYVGTNVGPIRNLTLRGTCVLATGGLNSCVRLIGTGDPSFTPQVIMDAKVISAIATTGNDQGGIGGNNNRDNKAAAHITLGPSASMQNVAGGYANLLNRTNVWVRGFEPNDVTGAVGETIRVRVPAVTLGASPPYCLDLGDGAWRACTDERTRLRKPDWPKTWMQRASVRLYGAPAASTTCNIRVLKSGTVAGTTEYFPGGHPFALGGDGLVADGDSAAWNVAEIGTASDYWQVQIDDDYATIGGEEACLATVASGYATSNGTTTTLNDSTKAWTTDEHSSASRRVVIEAGDGALALKTITSNTATQITWSGAIGAATHGADNIKRTKYRIVASSGACTCLSKALPEMDVQLYGFPVNQ